MIPKDHICFFVEKFTEDLNYSNFDSEYDGAGAPAYHPRILLKILIQGMISKIRSSRKLSSACRENFIFMYLAEKTNPNFNTIARFRKENKNLIKSAFKKTVQMATKHNLIDLDLICIDGSMIKAYASKKRVIKREAVDLLDKAIDKMMDEDIALDEIEQELYSDKEDNLTGMDRKDMKRIFEEFKNSPEKNKIQKRIKKAKKEVENNTKLKKVSITDPNARMMQNKKGYPEVCYNTQFSVDSKNQIILANDACQDGHDAHQFIPQIENIEKNIKLKNDTKVGVDCGYSDGINIKYAEDKEIDLYVPNRAQAQKFGGKSTTLNHDKYDYDWNKDEIIADGIRYPYHHSYIRKNDGRKILVYQLPGAKQRKQVPEFFRERLRMKEKMEKTESKAIYDLRKQIVEPVIGNIKENLGFRELKLRGLNEAKIELNLVSIAHNLKKIWKKINGSVESSKNILNSIVKNLVSKYYFIQL